MKNAGQVSPEAIAYARLKTYTLWVTREALVFDGVAPESRERDVTRMQLLGIRPEVSVEMDKPLSGKVSYLVGNDPAKWVKGVGLYQEIVYSEIYPHIDLRVAIKDRRIEYDFVVRPGGDLDQIRFAFEGAAGKSEITGEGHLELKTSHGVLIQERPKIYQVIDGRVPAISGGFEQSPEGHYACQVASYQRKAELIIDPAVELRYSTYLGGSGEDRAVSVAVGPDGSLYMAGNTLSSDFPLGEPHAGEYQSGYDVFVSKLSPDGRWLYYNTYLGGSGADYCSAVASDGAGNVVVAGYTDSTNFPTETPLQTTLAGSDDAFLLKTDGCTGKTLQAGESCSAQVVFDPLMAGPETATLLVPSTDPDESLITVALRGVGLASGFGVKPSKGTIGTRVKLTGGNLGQSSGAIYVGNSKCKVSSWSALAVNGTVSGPRKPGKYDVRIQPAGGPAMTLSKAFTIMAPAIKSIKPASGAGGGKITIKGQYFGTKAGKVLVGNTRCRILKWSMLPASGAGSIVAEIPAGLAPGSYDVTVVNKVGKAKKNGAFKVN